MDQFYVVIEGQKQGPFDLIEIIKKTKNGIINSETMVSRTKDGEFVPASKIEQINLIIAESEEKQNKKKGADKEIYANLSLGKAFKDGIDLWLKYVISFTVMSGLILSIAFGLNKALIKIDFFAEHITIANFITASISTFLYLIFFNYILLAKRNQTTQIVNFFSIVGNKIPSFLILSLILSLYTIGYGINDLIGLIVLLCVMVLSSFIIFSPFLIYDRGMNFGKAINNSISKVSKAGIDNLGVILALIAINLAAAILPAFLSKDLFVFGLFLSLPITVSALAFIYDEIFA